MLDRGSLTLFVLSVLYDLCHPPGFLEATSLMKVKNPEGEFYVKIKTELNYIQKLKRIYMHFSISHDCIVRFLNLTNSLFCFLHREYHQHPLLSGT